MVVFLDDIMVYSKTFEDDVRHVRIVLDKLCEYKLFAKLSKCDFFQKEITYLGHHISRSGVSMQCRKRSCIAHCPSPWSLYLRLVLMGCPITTVISKSRAWCLSILYIAGRIDCCIAASLHWTRHEYGIKKPNCEKQEKVVASSRKENNNVWREE